MLLTVASSKGCDKFGEDWRLVWNKHTYIHTYIHTDRQTDKQMDGHLLNYTHLHKVYTFGSRVMCNSNPVSDDIIFLVFSPVCGGGWG